MGAIWDDVKSAGVHEPHSWGQAGPMRQGSTQILRILTRDLPARTRAAPHIASNRQQLARYLRDTMRMQHGPTRRKTVEFEAVPGWQGAPQTLDAIPLPATSTRPRPHANLRPGAVTFPDVGGLSFRVTDDAGWRDLLPYSVIGFTSGWVFLGLISWWF